MLHKRNIVILIALALLVIGGFFLWRKYSIPKDAQKLTLTQAARMGEFTQQKLLVQISRPKGTADNVKGRYERGDIVLVADADKEFSATEKSIFLIIKMDLTPKQKEILTLSMVKDTGEKDEDNRPVEETLKRRKFYVDLKAVGIADEDEGGKEITDKSFEWSILKQKEIHHVK